MGGSVKTEKPRGKTCERARLSFVRPPLSAFAEAHGLVSGLMRKLLCYGVMSPKVEADNRGVAEGEDGYFSGTTRLHAGAPCQSPDFLAFQKTSLTPAPAQTVKVLLFMQHLGIFLV